MAFWGTPVCWVEKLSDYSYELEHCQRFGPSPAGMPTETEYTSSVWRYDRLKGTVQPVNEEAEVIAGTARAPALGEE